LVRLAPGPSDWINADTLRTLASLGMACEFASLAACATAAAARTYKFENHAWGGLRVQRRCRQLMDRFHREDEVSLRHAAWIRSCSLFTLAAAAEEVSGAERAAGGETPLMDEPPDMDAGARRTWQRRVVRAMRPDGAPALAHARRRLDRWAIPLLPGRRVARLVNICGLIVAKGTPRIAAAFIRTAFNGWCTARRFQGRAGCLLACPGGHDSIEHYAVCPVFARFCAQRAGLATPAAERRLECFLNLGRSVLLRRDLNTPEHAHLLRALAVYSLYRVQAAVRAGDLTPAAAPGALPHMLREGARGHAGLEALLYRLRRRPLQA